MTKTRINKTLTYFIWTNGVCVVYLYCHRNKPFDTHNMHITTEQQDAILKMIADTIRDFNFLGQTILNGDTTIAEDTRLYEDIKYIQKILAS